jgi:hypothetical protein
LRRNARQKIGEIRGSGFRERTVGRMVVNVDSRGDGEDAETRRKGMEDQSALGQPKS